MKQYNEIKARYPGAILFFRMGDFYEMFGDDALVASKALQITLTSRSKGSNGERMPLCGVPHHSADTYIARLIKQGFKVAVCEQVEDPKTAKGIVKREVVRVITPGTLLEDNLLNSSENNFLAAVFPSKTGTGLSFLDISTGEFFVCELPEGDADRLAAELNRIGPSEILVPEGSEIKEPLLSLPKELSEKFNRLDEWQFDRDAGERKLTEHLGVHSLEGFGAEGMAVSLGAAGAILAYLTDTQPAAGDNITRLRVHRVDSFMAMDESSIRNLEIVESPSGYDGTLLARLSRTETPMGARMLRSWLVHPLLDVSEIRARHEAVEELSQNASMRDNLRDGMRNVYDIERLMARIASGVAGPRDLGSLRSSLSALPNVRASIESATRARLTELKSRLGEHTELNELIEYAITEDPPATLKDGGVIRQGYSHELDELRTLSREGKGLIAKIEADERMKSGIDSLKVKFNKVFGYYLEVTKANLDKVPDYFIRKQTLVNAERFITPELKEYEDKVLGAEEKMVELEARLFAEVRSEAAEYAAEVQESARVVAELDTLASFAESAARNGYVRPEIDDSDEIVITDGRHPVIEALTGSERFIPNDTRLDRSENLLLIITGPNMAGKSTYMRQVALIVLMAQVGSFVPAASARIGVVDRIFTRVGASDNIARGQSTFMVEMNETANILNNSTSKSLIILDEIGRGTSTFDGLSIAWAVAEYISDPERLGAKTLFATHYHELTDLEGTCPGIRNYNIAVREWKDDIVFLRKIVEGGADKSYGIQVARLAGLPRGVIARSKQILANLERVGHDKAGRPKIAGPEAALSDSQMDIFAATPPDEDLREELISLDLDNMTPMEALRMLNDLKNRATED